MTAGSRRPGTSLERLGTLLAPEGVGATDVVIWLALLATLTVGPMLSVSGMWARAAVLLGMPIVTICLGSALAYAYVLAEPVLDHLGAWLRGLRNRPGDMITGALPEAPSVKGLLLDSPVDCLRAAGLDLDGMGRFPQGGITRFSGCTRGPDAGTWHPATSHADTGRKPP